MEENTEILKELMDVKAERDALKTERAEILEQVNNLGKFIGRPGMAVAHIVTETVSKIEKLELTPPFSPPDGSFQKELTSLINRHSIENGSNTPDFILAEYLRQCLDAFDMATRRREEWHTTIRPD